LAQFSGAPHGPGMSWTRRWGRAQLSPKSRSRVGHAPPSGHLGAGASASGRVLLARAGLPVGVVPAPVRAAAVASLRMRLLGDLGDLVRQPLPPGSHERPGAKPRGPGRPRVMEERQTLLARGWPSQALTAIGPCPACLIDLVDRFPAYRPGNARWRYNRPRALCNVESMSVRFLRSGRRSAPVARAGDGSRIGVRHGPSARSCFVCFLRRPVHAVSPPSATDCAQL
jgi:hypothetical protein